MDLSHCFGIVGKLMQQNDQKDQLEIDVQLPQLQIILTSRSKYLLVSRSASPPSNRETISSLIVEASNTDKPSPHSTSTSDDSTSSNSSPILSSLMTF